MSVQRTRATVAVTTAVTALIVVLTFALFSTTAWSSDSTTPSGSASSAATAPDSTAGLAAMPQMQAASESKIKNVVFILADDLDWAAFEQVPRLKALESAGMTFRNFVVTDSLCCPSRSSILRSQYVHNHLVVSNRDASGGGWQTFYVRGEENDCLATWLHDAGVQTAFFGKYLNEFGKGKTGPTWVPPGWDRWFVPVTDGAMYRGYNYTIDSNGTLVKYGDKPKDFLPDVLIEKSTQFIENTTEPFYVQINPTTPHAPFPVAKRHAKADKGAHLPQTASFNAVGLNEAPWRASLPKLSPKRLKKMEKDWRQRVRSAESIADAYDAVRASLQRSGKLDSTLIVVGSDNGFHAANRRLPEGKRTPYAEDTVVPYVFIGPDVPAAKAVNDLTSTIDLGPTFSALLGGNTPTWTDGRSLVPFLADASVDTWRTGILTESLSAPEPGDPDFDALKPPRFESLRTQRWVYVEYADGSKELFDRAADPVEMNNVIDTTDPTTVAALARQLRAFENCAGDTCRIADALPN